MAFDSGNRLSDFHKGDRVIYLTEPLDTHKPEHGVVSSVGAVYVFVKYDNATGKMLTGDEPYTAQATDARDLIFEDQPPPRENPMTTVNLDEIFPKDVMERATAFPVYDMDGEFIWFARSLPSAIYSAIEKNLHECEIRAMDWPRDVELARRRIRLSLQIEILPDEPGEGGVR